MDINNLTKQDIINMVDSLPGDFVVCKLNGKKLEMQYCSNTVPGYFGMNSEEFKQANTDDAFNVIVESDHEYVFESVDGKPVGPEIIELSFRLKHKSNGFFWAHAKSKIIGKMDGCPVILSNYTNLTNEVSPYSEILDYSDTRIYVIDRHNYEILFMNNVPFCSVIPGTLPIDDNRFCYKMIHGYESPCYSCSMNNVVNNVLENRDIYDKHTKKWLHIKRQAVNWCGHEAIITFMTDISDRIRREQTIMENQQALNSLIKSTPAGIFVYAADESQEFSYINEHMLSMLGYTRDSFTEKFHNSFAEMVYYEDRERVLKEIDTQIYEGSYDTCEYRIEKQDGTLLWVHDEGHLVTDADGKKHFFVVIVDITSSLASSNKMMTQYVEMNRIIQTIPAGIVVYRKSGEKITIENVNQYLCELVHVPYTVLTTTPYEELLANINPDDMEVAVNGMETLFSDEHSANFTFRTKGHSKTGDAYYWVNCSGKSVVQADGTQIAYAIYTDASKQKESEARYNKLMEEYVNANPNALGTFRLNITQNSFIGGNCQPVCSAILLDSNSVTDFFARFFDGLSQEEDAVSMRSDLTIEYLSNAYNDGQTTLSYNFKYQSDDGSLKWATNYIHLIKNPTTNDIEAVSYILDTDENIKGREIAKRASGSDCDFIALINLRTKTRSFYSINDVNFKSLADSPTDYDTSVLETLKMVANDGSVKVNMNKLSLSVIVKELNDNSEYIVPVNTQTPDGTHYRKQLKFTYLDDSKNEILEVARDITVAFILQQAQMDELQAALNAAEKASASKSEFMSRVSHDIRTPMNIISGMTNFAMQDMNNKDKLTHDLESIKNANAFLLSLINDTLDIAKIDSGQIELHPEPYPYATFVDNITTLFTPLCDEKGLKLKINRAANPPETVIIDNIRLNQLVLNLISNSIKYTPTGGTIEFSTGGATISDGFANVFFTVKDSGIGMSKEFQNKMFEPFTQEKIHQQTLVEKGTGLGLSIVKKIVDLMDGTISVESELNKGTTITVTFTLPVQPLSEAMQSKTALAGDHAEDVKSEYHSKRLMLAEDNQINAEIAQRILEGNGYHVDLVTDGEKAVSAFEVSEPGYYFAILMDIQMPLLDGIEATRLIRSSVHPDADSIPIFALSANAYSEDLEKCKKAGMNGHISKPIDPALLIDTLENIN